MSRIFLALLLSASLTAAAAEPSENSFVYHDNLAVVRLLKRMDLLAKARGQLAQPPADTDLNLQEIMRHMARHASDDEIYRAIAPTYSRYISINDANSLSKAAPDVKAYTALTKQVQADEPDYLAEWARAYLMQRLSREAMRNFEKVDPIKPGAQLPQLQPERVGVAAIDAPLALCTAAQLASFKLTLAVMDYDATQNTEDPLDPTRLVSAAGIAKSRASVRRIEEQMEHFLSTSSRSRADFLQGMSAVLTDRKLRETFERGWSVGQHKDLDFAEQQRAAVSRIQRVLDFAESRLGKIEWDGENLIFDDDDDIELYNALLDQLQALKPAS